MIDIIDIFPTPVYFTEIPLQKFDFSKLEYEKSSAGGWISKDQTVLECSDLNGVKNTVLDHVKHYYHQVLGFSPDVEIYITGSWATRHDPGDYADSHIHENSFISGVIYYNVSENSGELSFHLSPNAANRPFPPTLSPPVQRDTKYNSRDVHVTVRNGLLLLFPSNVLHSVSPNNSDQSRYVIAFNTWIRGEMGGITRTLKL